MELKLFTPLVSIEHEMQSLLDRAFGRTGDWPLRPTMDVTQEKGRLTVEMELPGLEAGDVDIQVEDDMLVVSGEKHRSREVREEHRYLSERTFGSFERRVALPEGYDVDGIAATFESGVLSIEVPVSEPAAAVSRHIPVTTAP